MVPGVRVGTGITSFSEVSGVSSGLVIWHDEALLVLDKPAGLATVKGEGVPMSETLMYQARAIAGEWVYPVHRLDRATSGLVVFARSPEVAHRLSLDFAERRVHKEYLALVRGFITSPQTIDRPLARLDRDDLQEAETKVFPELYYTAPWRSGSHPESRYTLVRLKPSTGRTHQLRRHLNGIAHPIVGDTKYGDGKHNRAFREHLGQHRLFLHAERLSLTHPINGTILDLSARFADYQDKVHGALQQHN